MADLKNFMKPEGSGNSTSTSSIADKVKSYFSSPDTGKAGAPYRPDSLRGSNDKVENTSRAHNPTANAAPSSNDEYKIDFHTNILDNYDAYTYHWKLFITPLTNAYDGTVLDPKIQTIIAETGVTDVTIEKVEMNGIAVPSIEGGTGTQTLVKFQITEPSGASLLDKLYYESLSLGIGNWLVMPCFLQLEFRSRDPVNSEASSSGETGGLNALRWIWPIKLTNSKAHVSHVGTKYDFDAIVYDELAQSNSYFSILHNIILDKLDAPFTTAIKRLEEKIMEDQEEKVINGNYGLPDVYKFIVDPDLRNQKELVIVVPDKNQHTSRHGGDYFNFHEKQASYNPGTGIDKIIDSLLGNTRYFQKKLQSAESSISRPYDATKAEPMRKLWRIVTETHPYAYDYIRQDNAVEITVYIAEYNLGLIETIADQTAQTPQTQIAAKKRMNEYFSKKILRKRYDYIFTGLNDQIIQFDLNMNFSFAAAISRLNGVYYDTAGGDMGVVAQNFTEEEIREAQEFNKKLKMISRPENSASKETEIAAMEYSLANAKLRDDVKKEYTRLLDLAKQDRLNSKSFVADAKMQEESRAKSSRSLATSNSQNLRFLSDVDISTSNAKEIQKSAESLRKGKLRPIPYRESMQEVNLSMGTEPTSDAARARTSNVFSTALYSTLDASLQTIKLVIKGDPYWLFPREIDLNAKSLPFKTKMGEVEAFNVIKNIHITHPNSVNLFGTDNFIILRLRTPKPIDNETGLLDRPEGSNVEVETFSGVYKVVTVVSKFENGKFVQELFCILDPIINLQDFINEIEMASGRKSAQSKEETARQQANQNFRRSEIAEMNNAKSNIPSAVATSRSIAETNLAAQGKELEASLIREKDRLRARFPLGG